MPVAPNPHGRFIHRNDWFAAYARSMPDWLLATTAGLLAGGALLVGAVVAWFVQVPRRIVAGIMAFGAGVLISALAFDLVLEAQGEGGFWPTVSGFAVGAVVYVIANRLLDEFDQRKPRGPGTDPGTVLAVHPTQLYETAIMLGVFMMLWRLRTGERPIGWLFGLYLVLVGLERFLIEILRAKDDRFLGPFTIAQLTSVILIAIGAALLSSWSKGASPAPGAYLETGKKAS